VVLGGWAFSYERGTPVHPPVYGAYFLKTMALASPLGRSRDQISEFPTELPTHTVYGEYFLKTMALAWPPSARLVLIATLRSPAATCS